MSCIFCKIVNGEIPAKKLYEDDEFIAILDAFPSSVGHTLIIPKTHVDDVFEIDENMAGRAFALAAMFAKKMRIELNCDGVNILQNNREAAGQTVHHFHVHVIPRYAKDNVAIKWSLAATDEHEAEKVWEKLRFH